MPLYFRKFLEPEGEVGVWQIREDESFFTRRLLLTREERRLLRQIKGAGRRLEWLSSRYLLHYLSGRKVRGTLFKDANGKPHLKNSPYLISLSHSHEMAAVMGAPVPCGIDIQYFVPRINRLVHKFMSEPEQAFVEPECEQAYFHVMWCAKEAIYKAYGRRQLDFKKHIHIAPFRYSEAGFGFSGRMTKPEAGVHLDFDLFFEKLDDYFLVYALQKQASNAELPPVQG
ncbi:MAG: 4'-phosphopantetheinyl transferase superfamily protein [Bacteroidetes bacterium]|nr:MAG: 4'-phosphopantetheinyl transferase superfamily protein [Bacteroidota bacterium]